MQSPFPDVPHDFRVAPGAFAKVQHDDLLDGVRRHLAHDWGEATGLTRRINALSLEHGGWLLSVFTDRHQVTFYVTSTDDDAGPLVYLDDIGEKAERRTPLRRGFLCVANGLPTPCIPLRLLPRGVHQRFPPSQAN